MINQVVMCDIKTQMIKITKERPINNDASFSMTLLWQIFEAAQEHFEEWESLSSCEDKHIEEFFKVAFPNFIANYPNTMELDA